MAAQYSSKHGIVSRSPMLLYMAFTDLRNFQRAVPAGAGVSVVADYDRVSVTAKGVTISAKVTRRVPYSLIELESDNSPIEFSGKLHFDDAGAGNTDFWVEVEAEIPAMLKVMIGGKLKGELDKLVDTLVCASAGL